MLLIGIFKDKVFLTDSHPVVEGAGGELTAVAMFSGGAKISFHSVELAFNKTQKVWSAK